GEERLTARLIGVPEEPLPVLPETRYGVQLVRDEVDVDVERRKRCRTMQLDEDDVRGRHEEEQGRGRRSAPERRGHARGSMTLSERSPRPGRRCAPDSRRAR